MPLFLNVLHVRKPSPTAGKGCVRAPLGGWELEFKSRPPRPDLTLSDAEIDRNALALDSGILGVSGLRAGGSGDPGAKVQREGLS